MNILFLSDNFPPEVNAPALRTHEHCMEWVNQGANVTVITCFPNFPKGKIYPGYKNKLYQKEEIDGIKVIRVWSFMSENKGFLMRTLDFISYAFMALVFGLFQKFDVVIGTSPQFFTAISARLIAFFRFKKWIMEVRDLWPETIAAVGAMNTHSFSYRLLEKIEKHLYKSSKIIIVNAEGIKNSINQKGIKESKIKVIKNGVIVKDYLNFSPNKRLREKHNLIDYKLITYIGTIGMCHALNFILNCFQNLKDSKIHLLIIGDGAEKDNLMLQAEKLKLENITFLPSIKKELVNEYINISDVALVNLKKSDTFQKIIPSKIFENVAMKKPILLGVEGEAKDLIEKYNVGVCYEPENEDSFHKALNKIIQNGNNRMSFNKACENMMNDFDRTKLAIRMLDIITYECCNNNTK